MLTTAHTTEIIVWLLLGALALVICWQLTKPIDNALGAPLPSVFMNPFVRLALFVLGPFGLMIALGFIVAMAFSAEFNIFISSVFRHHPDQFSRSMRSIK